MTSSSSSCTSNSSCWVGTLAAFAAGSLATAAYFQLLANKKTSKATDFPATVGIQTATTTSIKATASSSIEYPHYDYKNDPKGSFTKICDMLIEEILRELPANYELPPRETDWLRKMLEHTVKGGKMNRGLMVVESGVAIIGEDAITNDKLCQLAVLGWAIEWLQAWLLVADDIMDSSVTRRGQPCWYKTIGDAWYIAINDAVTIEAFVYKIIKRHFCYDSDLQLKLMDLMMETTLQTELGQLSDTLCDVLALQDLTPERWHLIVKYKTSFYSFYLSVAFAMTLAGVSDQKAYDSARDILIEMGVYFQAQDDFLDCYATPEVLGKIGTDIADKKCGWLFTKAYHQLANDTQKAFLDEHYGKCKVGSPEEIKIKELYTELGLKEIYAEYEQDSYDKIMALKNSASGETLKAAGVPWTVFEKFLAKVYKRSH
uniref:Farnesyl diphosphate synthase n=1 Tax=Pseudo-nitzschia australis TaxID=44445 RepID=A0A7S4EEA9_9STRA|mmetsp:Transcript_27051/g.59499  ORF Transcript_27051/g.59499 Transcript_27051/m.59499 type:complete len:430 (+) Transcript_27051:114-1403(+)